MRNGSRPPQTMHEFYGLRQMASSQCGGYCVRQNYAAFLPTGIPIWKNQHGLKKHEVYAK